MRILEFIVSFGLLVASFWAMAAAFTPEYVGYEVAMFTFGILLFTASFALPVRRFLKA